MLSSQRNTVNTYLLQPCLPQYSFHTRMVIMVEVVKNLAWVYRVGREREFDRTRKHH